MGMQKTSARSIFLITILSFSHGKIISTFMYLLRHKCFCKLIVNSMFFGNVNKCVNNNGQKACGYVVDKVINGYFISTDRKSSCNIIKIFVIAVT